jgi:hypothetical protein
MRRNYDLVYYVADKCGNYRDTGVSKNREKENGYIRATFSNRKSLKEKEKGQ